MKMSGLLSIITALAVYLLALAVAGLLFILAYQTPSLAGNLENIAVIPGRISLLVLGGASALAVIYLLLMNTNKKVLMAVSGLLILFSAGLIIANELVYRASLARFFGDYGRGKIIFLPEFKAREAPDVFYLASRITGAHSGADFEGTYKRSWHRPNSRLSPSGAYLLKFNKKDCKFEVCSAENDQKISAMKQWVICPAAVSWSPDSRYFVYDYAYDRDDLSKIFAANAETGEIILLAAGSNPVWIE